MPGRPDHAGVPRTSRRSAWEWPATGTIWRVHHDGGVSAALAERVRALVAADEARWSRFRPESETARITAAAGAAIAVSDETLMLLAACAAWVRDTQGVFQPLVGAAVAAWGYAAPAQVRAPAAADPPPAVPVSGAIEIDRDGGCVRIPVGTALDLGGVAKGWMADRAARLLAESAPGAAGLVDAGGDMAVAGGVHDVTVAHRHRPPASVTLRPGTAIATSGPHARSWPVGDRHAHHLIDPATGAPGDAASATVLGPTCAEADVWAKVLALRPGLVTSTRLGALVTSAEGGHASAAWPG